jgi:hypothetical protein
MKRVVMQHEDDADAIAYRRSPTKQGRGEIMLRVRQKKVRRYLPAVAILSILMGTFLLIVASQIQMTVPFVAWCGIIQFLTGVVSVMAANNCEHARAHPPTTGGRLTQARLGTQTATGRLT